jgi:adenylate cyclase
VELVIGEETRRRLGDTFVFRELDLVRVKGKAKAITVYEPLCRREAITPALEEELGQHASALARFRSRDWEGAESAFAALYAAHPQVFLYAIYRDRISRMRASDPGETWDGVYEMERK